MKMIIWRNVFHNTCHHQVSESVNVYSLTNCCLSTEISSGSAFGKHYGIYLFKNIFWIASHKREGEDVKKAAVHTIDLFLCNALVFILQEIASSPVWSYPCD